MTQNTFCEHIVKEKCRGKVLAFKVLLIALYISLLVFPSLFIIMRAPSSLTVAFLIVIATVVFIIFKLTWRLTNVEYEYQIIDDTIIFTKILDKTRRKTVIEMPQKKFSVLGKYTPDSEKYLSRLLVDRSFLMISSFDADNIYFGVFEADDLTCIVYFEATENAIQKLKKYASGAMRAYERELKQ